MSAGYVLALLNKRPQPDLLLHVYTSGMVHRGLQPRTNTSGAHSPDYWSSPGMYLQPLGIQLSA